MLQSLMKSHNQKELYYLASISKKTTKTGKTFYEIRCHVERDRPTLTKRWYPPDGWSQKAIDRELKKVAAEFERQCRSGEVLSRTEEAEKKAKEAEEAAKIMTVKQYGEQVFIPAMSVHCAGNTIASFQGNLKNHIYPAIGNIKMPDVTSAQIITLLLNVQNTGKAHSTVAKIYTVLMSLFKMAYKTDVVEKNPMDKVDRPKPRKDEVIEEETPAYTVEEVRQIFKCLSQEPLKWQLYIRIMADTGIRRGECCGLQWDDFDYDKHTVSIRRTVNYTPKTGLYVSTTKSRRIRTIDIDPKILHLAKLFHREQKFVSKWVFTQDDSPEPMFPTSPTRYMKQFSNRHGIEDFHPHKLRHTFASIAITHGADIASISEKLGHYDKSVTLRMYTHSDQESMRRASQMFRDALEEQPEDKKDGKKKKDRSEEQSAV